MYELGIILLLIAIYIFGYYYVVHGRLSCEYTGIRVDADVCRVVKTGIFEKNVLFNPSMTSTKDGHLVVVHRYTPGHQIGACVAYIEDRDHEEEFEINGIKYRRRAYIGWGFNPSEPLYVPTNVFPWQWENGIWKQGEDIRLISPNECLTVFPYVFENRLLSRLVRCEIIRDVKSKKLTLGSIKIISPYGESHKNWVYLAPKLYLTNAFPRWIVRRESGEIVMDVDKGTILRKLNIKISSHIHLGGCSCKWSEDTMIVAMHTVRPYRNILCEISSKTYNPLRISHPLQLSDSRNTFIENVTGLAHHKGKLYLSWGYEDRESRFTILSRDKVRSLLSIDVSDL